MNSVSLEFSDADLERQFDRYMLHGQFWVTDGYCLWTQVPLLVLALAFTTPPGEYRTYYYLVLVFQFASLYVRRRLGVDGMEKWRTCFVITVRYFVALGMALARPHMCHLCGLPARPIPAILGSLAFNDVSCCLINNLVLRLKFKYHILFHIVSFPLIFPKATTFCICMAASPGAEHFFMMEDFVDHFAGTAMALLSSYWGTHALDAHDYEPCYQFAAFIHVYLCFFFSSYIIWCSERKSRVQFVRMLHGNNGGGVPDIQNLDVHWMIHLTVLIVGFAFCWHELSWLPPLVKKWGWPPVTPPEVGMKSLIG